MKIELGTLVILKNGIALKTVALPDTESPSFAGELCCGKTHQTPSGEIPHLGFDEEEVIATFNYQEHINPIVNSMLASERNRVAQFIPVFIGRPDSVMMISFESSEPMGFDDLLLRITDAAMKWTTKTVEGGQAWTAATEGGANFSLLSLSPHLEDRMLAIWLSNAGINNLKIGIVPLHGGMSMEVAFQPLVKQSDFPVSQPIEAPPTEEEEEQDPATLDWNSGRPETEAAPANAGA